MQKPYDGPDRRRYVRIPEKCLLSREPVAVRSFDGEEYHNTYASISDLSEGGILFQSDVAYEIDSFIRLQIDVPGWEEYRLVFYAQSDLVSGPFSVIGKVVRVDAVAPGHFDIGISFIAVDVGHWQGLHRYLKELKTDA